MMISTAESMLTRDLVTLARFVRLYCDGQHRDRDRSPAEMRFCNVSELMGGPLVLCPDCTKLLTHAFYKRVRCPMDPKPECKHCPQHCYHPNYRQQIREVMRYAGWRMVARGRVDLLWHMFF